MYSLYQLALFACVEHSLDIHTHLIDDYFDTDSRKVLSLPTPIPMSLEIPVQNFKCYYKHAHVYSCTRGRSYNYPLIYFRFRGTPKTDFNGRPWTARAAQVPPLPHTRRGSGLHQPHCAPASPDAPVPHRGPASRVNSLGVRE